MTELKDLFVPCTVCGEDTPFLQDEMCHKHLLLREGIVENTDFAFKVLIAHLSEIKRLKAIASKIKDYDYHSIRSAQDQRDGMHRQQIAEELLAQIALDEAIELSRG